jgi:uroporphyrin-III C-methyltransferase
VAAANRRGNLYLIGAGPGDPDLLTIKAVRMLGECDVILHDRLGGPGVLAYARPDAEIVYVGKHHGGQEHTQQEILDLIRKYALAGKTVARLKGGDPLVFGRGAEEWEFALKNGIDAELIPGVSSAISVPGLAGIPLTHRGISQSFAVITGHCREGLALEWKKYAGLDTLVVLMGVQNRAFIAQSLITAGRPPNEPVAFIERGTMDGERIVESTLADVAEGNTNVSSPAVFVIGEVVKTRGALRLSSQESASSR